MTILDDKLVPKAKIILEKLGRNTTVEIELDNNDYDPVTSKPIISTASHVVKASPPFELETSLVSDDNVETATHWIIIAASGLAFTPEVGMTVIQGSDRWEVVKVKQHDSGEQTAIYELHVRL